LDIYILDIVKCSSVEGWDFLIPSLVSLGFYLLDSKLESPNKSINLIKSEHMSLVELGSNILLELFKIHNIVKKEILENIFNRIIINSDNILMYVTLLKKLTHNFNSDIQEYISMFIDTFEYISMQSTDIYSALLEAVNPLFKNRKFQDFIILQLRKSMFNRETEARLIALRGFITLLKSKSDNREGSSTVVKNSLDIEIINNLRRCLTQQYEVKEELYKCFLEVLETKPEITENIMNFLLDQVQFIFKKSFIYTSKNLKIQHQYYLKNVQIKKN
jgi:fanconi anemia group I protein